MREQGAILPPKYDPQDPDVLADPYPTYARLRQAGTLCRGGPAQWVVTRYDEVAALLRDRRLEHRFPGGYYRAALGDGEAAHFFERIVLNQDPPQHTRLRHLMGKSFSPSLVRRMNDHIGELVDAILEPALDRGALDAVTDFAFPLPVAVICELMGIPSVDRNEVRPHATNLGKIFCTQLGAEDRASANEAVRWLRGYLGALVDERARAPGEDLLSLMLEAEEDGERLTRGELVDNAVFLFFAGFETTMNLLAGGCVTLLQHPGVVARLRREPPWTGRAVEELLRYDAPIHGVGRTVREPIEIAGRMIRPGRVLLLLLASANRDPRKFADPDRFDIERQPNPHLSFGGGIHHCLGAALARAESVVGFARLLQRFSVIEPAGKPVRSTVSTLRSYTSFPLSVRPA